MWTHSALFCLVFFPQRVSEAVHHSIPCLLLAGSGGAADCLANLLEETQPGEPLKMLAMKKMQGKFPDHELEDLAEEVRSRDRHSVLIPVPLSLWFHRVFELIQILSYSRWYFEVSLSYLQVVQTLVENT